jgi:hypothetical protein
MKFVQFYVACGGGGHAVVQLVEALLYTQKGQGFDPQWFHWNLSLTWFLQPHYGSSVDSASNRNYYKDYFLGVEVAGGYG